MEMHGQKCYYPCFAQLSLAFIAASLKYKGRDLLTVYHNFPMLINVALQSAWYEDEVDRSSFDITNYAVLVTNLPPDAGTNEASSVASPLTCMKGFNTRLHTCMKVSISSSCYLPEQPKEQSFLMKTL
jgi:hypothetical protein